MSSSKRAVPCQQHTKVYTDSITCTNTYDRVLIEIKK